MSDDSRPSAAEGNGRGFSQWLGQFLDRIGLRSGGTVREEIVEALATEDEAGGDISPQERTMLSNVLSLREQRVDDVMVPRADIAAVPEDVTLDELLDQFRTAGHSRLLVFADSLDDPRGMIHIRDLMDFISEKGRQTSTSETETGPLHVLGSVDLSIPLASARIMRPVLYVPPSMPAMDLLVKMQATRTHIALVIDEYGGTDGLVSIEDLIEIVVGDIEDEHDLDAAPAITPDGADAFTADARATLDDVKDATGIDLSKADVAEDVDTLGGLVVTIAGRVPAEGETVEGPEGLVFSVLEADPRRLKRIGISRAPAESSEAIPAMEPG